MKDDHSEEAASPSFRAWLQRNRKPIKACLIFAITLTIWLLWYPSIVKSGVLDNFLELNAGMTAGTLRLLGVDASVDGTYVHTVQFSMRIGHECTSIVPMVLLICGALAYPAPIRQRFLCLAVGLPVLFVLNLFRTVTLYYVGVHVPDYFDMFHFVVWQSAMILAVIGLWLFWVGRLTRVQPT